MWLAQGGNPLFSQFECEQEKVLLEIVDMLNDCFLKTVQFVLERPRGVRENDFGTLNLFTQ
jgi:hypothetical protein